MLKLLTAATGGNILAVAVPVAIILLTGSFGAGWHQKGKSFERAQAKQAAKLDALSVDVEVDTNRIANELSDKIKVRTNNQANVNLAAIEEAALRQGRLEGKAEGYHKGFEDAANIPNTCITDPQFLSDGMRVGASSRYEAIFGGPDTTEQPTSGAVLLGYPLDPP